MPDIILISMAGRGYEKYVIGTSTSIEKCQSEAPDGDFFIERSVDLPTQAKCPIKGVVKIGMTGLCEGPADGSGCDFNHF